MKGKRYLPYIVSVLIALAVGALGSLITQRGMPVYEALIKPALTPPSAVFPIVWTILYILMGISAAMIWKSEHTGRESALSVYALQLALNGLWTILFFGFAAYFPAFLLLVLLWGTTLLMIRLFSKVNRCAGLLQIPYLIWLTFAAYLNFSIWLLNR